MLSLITPLVESYLAEHEPTVFLVESKVRQVRNTVVITLLVDTDTGIRLEQCIAINRGLRLWLESQPGFEDGNYELEVSSPGVGTPLKVLRQYSANIGRMVSVLLNTGERYTGKLTAFLQPIDAQSSVDAPYLTLQLPPSKKKPTVTTLTIPIHTVKETRVEVSVKASL